jgi:AraC family transcriptional regulator
MPPMLTPAELPKWVPGQVVCNSDSLGWQGVALRGYRYQGLDVQVPPLRDFTVVAYRRGATRMQRRFEGGWTRAHCVPGDLSLLTRAQASHWHWTEEIEVCHVYLAEALVARVAHDMLGRSVAEVRLHDVLKAQDPALTRAVDALAQEAQQGGLGGALYAEALGTQIAVLLLRRHAAVNLRDPATCGGLSPPQCRRLADYVDQRLNEALELSALAAQVSLGVWTFGRRFRASFGCAPHAWVIGRRVARAQQLLAQGVLPLKEVASSCGFADQAHMTRVFRARLNTTPAALRRGGTA